MRNVVSLVAILAVVSYGQAMSILDVLSGIERPVLPIREQEAEPVVMISAVPHEQQDQAAPPQPPVGNPERPVPPTQQPQKPPQQPQQQQPQPPSVPQQPPQQPQQQQPQPPSVPQQPPQQLTPWYPPSAEGAVPLPPQQEQPVAPPAKNEQASHNFQFEIVKEEPEPKPIHVNVDITKGEAHEPAPGSNTWHVNPIPTPKYPFGRELFQKEKLN